MTIKRLEGKIALITGGAKGIGKATATLFDKEGAEVIIADIDTIAGKAAMQEIGCHFIQLDVSAVRSWEKAMSSLLSKYKRLDVLVNNAGIMGLSSDLGPQDPEHASLESWQHVHAVNSDSVFLGCKYAIAAMKHSGGAIVNLSSRSGMVGMPGAAAYASSKASIRNHTKTVALYCCEKGYNIRCNSVHPGAVITPLWDPMLGSDREKQQKQIETGIPMGRMGRAEEVASSILYLASDESSFMTGAELVIDGGILAGASASFKKQD